LDDPVDRDKIKNFPLARYAAQYWAIHARFENASSRIKNGIECLFDADKPHFASWLWVYDEDRDRSMSTMCPSKPEAVPLYYAARLGFRDLVERLIAKHPEHVNARGGSEVTPMHVAAWAGHTDILTLLLEHGADLEGRGKHNRTPLILAAINGHVEFVRMLLKRGARTDAQSISGQTPLHHATYANKIQVLRLLLEHGADVNARDDDGKTPSQYRSVPLHPEIVELLSEYGAGSIK
jgi:ankyrin repeat protein